MFHTCAVICSSSSGRTIAMIERLWQAKGQFMAVPDCLICGNGVRIYQRRDATTGQWVEDENWTR